MNEHGERDPAHPATPATPATATHTLRRSPGRRRVGRTTLLWGAVAAALALTLSACGGGSPQSTGVATVTTTSRPHQSTTATTHPSTATTTPSHPNAVAYAQCMRSHGITNFPDPEPTGRMVFSVGTGINPQSAQFQAAQAACKRYLGSGAATPGGGSTSKEVLLAYAKCMRAHGVTNFPDPVRFPGGQWGFSLVGQVTQTSPSFQAANQKCKSRSFGGIHPCSGGGSLRSRYHARRC